MNRIPFNYSAYGGDSSLRSAITIKEIRNKTIWAMQLTHVGSSIRAKSETSA